jgi:hypothetical protein
VDQLDIARFWSSVDVGHYTACWPWTKEPNAHGYGEIKIEGTVKPAHQVAYELLAGPSPAGTIFRHKCDMPLCCNPTHIETGTHLDNVRDRCIRGRSAKGEQNAKHKLVEAQVREIRELSYHSATTIARRYGVHEGTIRAIWIGKTWKHVT